MPDILRLVFQNPVVAFVILVGVVVFVHELGHYLVGVLFKIKIEEFSLGFGPKAFGFIKNGTEYKVCWLPLGGYVRFAAPPSGNANIAKLGTVEGEKYLPTSKLYKRFLVSIAGPLANFILSVFVMIALAKSGLPAPDSLVSVMPNSPAEKAGLKTGDKIIRIKGEDVKSWAEINKNVSANPGVPLEVVVLRSASSNTLSEVTIMITPAEELGESIFGEKQKVGRIGVSQFFSVPKLVVPKSSFLGSLGVPNSALIESVGDTSLSMRHEVVQKLELFFASCENLLSETCETKIKFNKNNEIVVKGSALQAALNAKQSFGTKNSGNLILEPQKIEIANFWKKEIVSSDLTIGKLEELKKGDKRLPVQQAWSACGLKPGVTLIGHFDSDVGVWKDWQDPMGLASFLTKTNLNLREEAKAGNTAERVISAKLKTYGENGIGEMSCEIPTREAYGADGRVAPLLDFPFQFETNGVPVKPVMLVSDTFADAIRDGSQAALAQGTLIFNGLKKLVTGSLPLSNLGGPIAIAKVAQDAAEGGLLLFLLTISGMSMNIGMFNLLPLPSLDGGAILLQAIEALYGKPPSPAVQQWIQKAGVVVILLLFVVVFYNDIFRMIKS